MFTSTQIGQGMKKVTKVLLPLIILVGVIVLDSLVFIYQLGYKTGTRVHEINDQLGRFSVSLHTSPIRTLVRLIIPTPPTPPTTPYIHPFQLLWDEVYSSYTVKDLKNILGTRKKYNKQTLVGMMITY